MAPYHILIAMISSVIPGNLVLLVESEQFGPMAKCHQKTADRNGQQNLKS